MSAECLENEVDFCHRGLYWSLQFLKSLHRHLNLREGEPKNLRLENHLLIAHVYGRHKVVILLNGVILLPEESLVEGEYILGLHGLELKIKGHTLILLGDILSDGPGVAPNRSLESFNLLPIFLKEISPHLLQIDILDHVLTDIGVGVSAAIGLLLLLAMGDDSDGVGVQAAVHARLLQLAVF